MPRATTGVHGGAWVVLRPVLALAMRAEKRGFAALFVQQQLDGAIDQCEVSEALGEITEKGLGRRIDLFGEQSHVVALGCKALEQRACLIGAPGGRAAPRPSTAP
ncbi:MAG TPA: hypothetical protein VK138_05855 [Acidiferrobacterales bacterium]|nr:hypothetical protein [Acidiferrobacterales bacterium]